MFTPDEQDAMWNRIKAKLDAAAREHLVADQCDFAGHDWSSWSPYASAVFAGMDELIAVDAGERRHCRTCGEQHFRAVQFSEPHPNPFDEEREPWQR